MSEILEQSERKGKEPVGLNIRILENASPQSNFDLAKMKSTDGNLMTMVTSGDNMKPTGFTQQVTPLNE